MQSQTLDLPGFLFSIFPNGALKLDDVKSIGNGVNAGVSVSYLFNSGYSILNLFLVIISIDKLILFS